MGTPNAVSLTSPAVPGPSPPAQAWGYCGNIRNESDARDLVASGLANALVEARVAGAAVTSYRVLAGQVSGFQTLNDGLTVAPGRYILLLGGTSPDYYVAFGLYGAYRIVDTHAYQLCAYGAPEATRGGVTDLDGVVELLRQALAKSPKPPPTGRCRADQLRIAASATEAMMSQPFSDIAVTNTGAASCALGGYPRIHVWGYQGFQHSRAPTVHMDILMHHGIYERRDQGPHRIVVRPHHKAFFSIGTGTAYQGGLHMLTLTRLAVALPGTHASKKLTISLLATRPRGRPIPFGITALTRDPHP